MKKRFLTIAVIMSMLLTLFPQNYAFAISGTKGDSTPVIDGETLLFAENFDDQTTSELQSEYGYGRNKSYVGNDSGIYFTGQNENYGDNWDCVYSYGSGSMSTHTGKFKGNNKRYFTFHTAQSDAISSGVAHIYFGIMREGTRNTQCVDIFAYSNDNYDFMNHKLTVIPTATVNSFNNQQWYMVELFVDIDNGKCYVLVKKYDTGVVVYSDILTYSESNVRGVCVPFQYDTTESTRTIHWGAPKVDDLYIGKLNSVPSDSLNVPSGETSIYTTNFETLASGDEWNDNDALTDGGFRSWNESGIVPGSCYLFGEGRSVQAFSPTYDSGIASRTFEYYLPYSNKAEAESGRFFHIGFCYKPGTYATTNQINLYPYKSGADKLVYSAKAVEVLSTSEATGIGNRWVYIDLVIDLCEGYMRKTVTDTYSGTLISFDSVDISNLSDYGFYCLQWNIAASGTSWTMTNSPAIDDFTAGELYADEESIYSDAFDKYANLAALPSNYTVSSTDFAYDKGGDGHGNALSANCGLADNSWYIMYFRPDQPLAMGQYHITFDIRPGNTTGTNLSCGGGANNGSGIPIIPTGGFDVRPKTDWYKADIVYDAARSRASYNVYNSSGTSVKNGSINFTDSNNYNLSDEILSFLGWSTSKASSTGSTWSNDNCHAIDNLHIGRYKDYISAFSLNTGSNPVTTIATIHNRGAFNVNQLRVTVAAYNSSGDLIGFAQTGDTSVNSNTTGSLASASLTKPAGATTYKAFLWYRYDKDGVSFFKPLTQAVSVTP